MYLLCDRVLAGCEHSARAESVGCGHHFDEVLEDSRAGAQDAVGIVERIVPSGVVHAEGEGVDQVRDVVRVGVKGLELVDQLKEGRV
jgi:hypothetical protein